MKKLIAGVLAALTLATTVASPASAYDEWRRRPMPPRHHRSGDDAAAAAALGIVGGLILGGLAAQASQPSYTYEEERVVRRRPVRVYEEERVVRRHRRPACETLIKYDMYGRPYEYRDCDP